MNPQHRGWIIQRHVGGHARPEVAAVRAVPLISQPAHQGVPQPCGVPGGHPGTRWAFGEAVTGQRRDHDVEGRAVDAVFVRIGQQRHQRQVLGERARPAVRQDQRDAVAAPRPFVNEMNARAVDVGAEVVERVEPALLLAPVELVSPVAEHVAQVREIGALAPRISRRSVRPTRCADARSKVRQHIVIEPDRERRDLHGTPPISPDVTGLDSHSAQPRPATPRAERNSMGGCRAG